MKRILYLATALLTTASVASAQFTANSIWYNGFEKITCASESSKSFMFEADWWGEDGTTFTLTKTSENHFKVSNFDDYEYLERINDVEYRVVDGHKLLLFKDANGNILKHYEYMDHDMWEAEIIKGYHYILDGTYVDETGVKYVFDGEDLTMGNNKCTISLDPEMFYILRVNDAAEYWWTVTTTGINIYNVSEGEYGPVQGNVWHRLKEVSPNGRWDFLSKEIVPETFMWRYPSGLIRIIRNEIYARHGYVFNSADLKEYFSKQPWYKPLNNNNAVKLNAIETLNVELLKANETAAREGTDDEEIEDGL